MATAARSCAVVDISIELALADLAGNSVSGKVA